jgi:alcohol dehydrogenase (NADP+)
VGIVTQVGKGVTKFKLGDRAGVGCFVDSCRSCKYCQDTKDEMYCKKTVWTYNSKHYDGLQSQGGYSTHIVMDEG